MSYEGYNDGWDPRTEQERLDAAAAELVAWAQQSGELVEPRLPDNVVDIRVARGRRHRREFLACPPGVLPGGDVA